jgi:hypothetical protein
MTNSFASKNSAPEPWLSKAHVARHLSRSTRWVELMHHRGLPSVQISPGGRRLYRISEVEAWLTEQGRNA